MGVKSIVAKAVAPIQGKILMNLGVDEVIYPERDAAIRLAHRLVSPGVIEYLELSPGFSIEEVSVSDSLSGMSLEEIKLRGKHNLNIIGIKQQVSRMVKGRIKTEETFNFTPKPDDVVEKGDVLVMIGQEKDLDRFCNEV
jgi:trk system potassium uptake protein TrkA